MKGISGTKLVAILIMVACAVGGISLSVLLWNNSITEVRDIPMSFAVENIAAFNVGTDEVYFGSTTPGNTASRRIRVESSERRMVTAVVLGNISSVVTISDNNFILEPGGSRQVELVAHAPEDAVPVTRYNGTLRLIFRRV